MESEVAVHPAKIGILNRSLPALVIESAITYQMISMAIEAWHVVSFG